MPDPTRPEPHITASEVAAVQEELGVGVLEALRIARERKAAEAASPDGQDWLSGRVDRPKKP